MNKQETLQAALVARDEELEGYQINIDNYRLAMEKILDEHSGTTPMDVAMQEFSQQLAGLYESSLIEQRKSQIIRDVIAAQLNAP